MTELRVENENCEKLSTTLCSCSLLRTGNSSNGAMYRNKVSNPPPQTSVYTYHMPECCCEIGGDQTFNHFSEVKSNKS